MSQGSIPRSDEVNQRRVDEFFEVWSIADFPTYHGDITDDVERWLELICFFLELNTDRDIWHLVGFRLVRGHALDVLNEALESGHGPNDWDSFCTWAHSLNPLRREAIKAYNQSLVAVNYEKLRQGDKESAKTFFQRYRAWQAQADFHRYPYDPRIAFVDRLRDDLRRQVYGLMAEAKLLDVNIHFPNLLEYIFRKDGSSD